MKRIRARCGGHQVPVGMLMGTGWTPTQQKWLENAFLQQVFCCVAIYFFQGNNSVTLSKPQKYRKKANYDTERLFLAKTSLFHQFEAIVTIPFLYICAVNSLKIGIRTNILWIYSQSKCTLQRTLSWKKTVLGKKNWRLSEMHRTAQEIFTKGSNSKESQST